MSINDLRELSISELETKVGELKKELMESRFSLATSQIEDTSIFKKIKKQIAQANTVLNQRWVTQLELWKLSQFQKQKDGE